MKYNWNKKELEVQKSVVGQITSIGFHFIFKGCWASNATKPDLNLSELLCYSRLGPGYQWDIVGINIDCNWTRMYIEQLPVCGYSYSNFWLHPQSWNGSQTEAALTCGFYIIMHKAYIAWLIIYLYLTHRNEILATSLLLLHVLDVIRLLGHGQTFASRLSNGTFHK